MKFSGEYNVSIDLKGRISVPASFREELRDTYASDGLFVTKYKNGLVAYPPKRWDEICAKVFAMEPGPLREANLRNRIAPAKECTFNAQGRIQIPNPCVNMPGWIRMSWLSACLKKLKYGVSRPTPRLPQRPKRCWMRTRKGRQIWAFNNG